MKKPNNCKGAGVYSLLNLINNKRYIGSSKSLANRYWQHESCLNRNKHQNSYLQNSWNKYGEHWFVFEVLEFVDDYLLLDELENYYIAKYKSNIKKYGYNIRKVANSNRGLKRTKEHVEAIIKANTGITRSEKTRLKMSRSSIGNTNGQGEKNYFSKLNELQVRIIKRLLKSGYLNQREISEVFSVQKSCISKIHNSRTWTHIKQKELKNDR